MNALTISIGLGLVAGAANLFGCAIVCARPWSRTFLTYFIAAGSGFMLATSVTEMAPEAFRISPGVAPYFFLAGYFVVHFFEHSLPGHFHFGEETHSEVYLHHRTAYTALGGLIIHTFFDGVAIASGFLVSLWLGIVIFGAILLHNIPEGFTMASIMMAAGKGRVGGYWAVASLALSRLVGIVVMAGLGRWVGPGLSLSAGVTLYVAASDLIPEVNKTRGVRIAGTVAAGVVTVLVLSWIFQSLGLR